MRIQVLDLDGGLTQQQRLMAEHRPEVVALRDWGPSIRLGCRFGRFRAFERELNARSAGRGPRCTFVGSGDFHHVSLALVRRVQTPFNLLVLDNHPDWMRGIPFLHCGTWLYHAAQLPQVQTIFHVGGDVDFDNRWQWLAPWPLLRSGKIKVLPAVRSYHRRSWRAIDTDPIRRQRDVPVDAERLACLLEPHAAELARWPLYVSLDKDVMPAADAAVNWDSGHLRFPEVQAILAAFLSAARGNVAGMDVVGDWSPVRVRGALRHFLHLTEHPPLDIDPEAAIARNEAVNLGLLDMMRACCAKTAILKSA
jgi:hypothetical protein